MQPYLGCPGIEDAIMQHILHVPWGTYQESRQRKWVQERLNTYTGMTLTLDWWRSVYDKEGWQVVDRQTGRSGNYWCRAYYISYSNGKGVSGAWVPWRGRRRPRFFFWTYWPDPDSDTVIHHPMLHHHSMLHSYNIPHEHPILKINRQRHSNILNDPPHKISSKTNNFWMYYSQIIFGCYVFPPSVTPMFYLY